MVEQILFVSSIGDVWKQCEEYPYDTNSFLFFFSVFWLIVVSNDLNAQRVFHDHFLRIEGTIWQPKDEDGCYEYMSLIKSGGDGQSGIQLKRKLITGPVPTPDTIVSHSFPLPFCKRTMVSGTKHLVTGHFCPNLEKPSQLVLVEIFA